MCMSVPQKAFGNGPLLEVPIPPEFEYQLVGDSIQPFGNKFGVKLMAFFGIIFLAIFVNQSVIIFAASFILGLYWCTKKPSCT
jgi:hypothetical protein